MYICLFCIHTCYMLCLQDINTIEDRLLYCYYSKRLFGPFGTIPSWKNLVVAFLGLATWMCYLCLCCSHESLTMFDEGIFEQCTVTRLQRHPSPPIIPCKLSAWILTIPKTSVKEVTIRRSLHIYIYIYIPTCHHMYVFLLMGNTATWISALDLMQQFNQPPLEVWLTSLIPFLHMHLSHHVHVIYVLEYL